MSEELLSSLDPYESLDDYSESNSTSASGYPSDYLPPSPCSLRGVRQFSRVFVPVAYSLVCAFGLLGNVLVVLTFAFYKKAKSMTDIYLLNMAIADALFVLTLPFWAVSHAAGAWVFSNALCKLLKGIYAVNFHCGMLLLACVSLDRYVAIVQATSSFRLRAWTLTHSRRICSMVWALSLLISTSTFALNRKYKIQGQQVCEAKYPSFSEPVTWKLLGLGLELLFGFFVPFVSMLFCYALIVRTLLQAQNAKRHRAIRVVIAVVLVFLVCQIPHNAVLLVTAAHLGSMDKVCHSEKLLGYVRTVTEVLAFLHCCLNPVLYAFVGQRFRSYFLKIMKDAWCVRRRAASRLSCARIHSESCASRQTSEAVDDNASSFTM
ncbi:C-C chemokine receptor type 6 [Dipodomys spectabilis]|uniref:C-C chemokine receptor type 6 n=1 Tax=Dipodomys spectabilis TaxID=105255 RepID=UPI001C53BA7E|nr:C-C chemokine receptor type 6 [Dipodomys spectabilis]XP_042545647.1 C-C chemokine receptor type 6 [Dipodomys spectabilis]XP_042545648.1 C-C chemokine receptor type 6 [Dipodomys spectabilis]XP_042545649.1 C-C chemokine receptor type 6 [Dipodomys spectabilis]